eukprot:353273-Chlamydomonas_euryale.AAC.26
MHRARKPAHHEVQPVCDVPLKRQQQLLVVVAHERGRVALRACIEAECEVDVAPRLALRHDVVAAALKHRHQQLQVPSG